MGEVPLQRTPEIVSAVSGCESRAQGYLAHEKPSLLRTLHEDGVLGPMAVLGGGAFIYGRGTS